MTERDLIRRLEDQPTPPPPENLLERLVEDIPETLEVDPSAVRDRTVAPFRRRRWLYAVAAVLTLALTGAVTWQMQRGGSLAPQLGPLAGKDAPVEKTPRRVELPGTWVRRPTPAPAEDAAETTTSGEAGKRQPTAGSRSGRVLSRMRVAPGEQGGAESAHPPGRTEGLAASAPAPESVGEVKTREAPIPDPKPDEPTPVLDDESVTPQARYSEQEVVVTAEFPAIDVTSTQSGTVISEAPTAQAGERQPVARPRMVGRVDAEGRAAENRLWKRSVDVQDGGRQVPAPSTGGSAEPNDQPYGDVFFEHTGVNPFVDAEDDRLSTFGLDVDTGAFTVARRYLSDGHLPPQAAIRVEEFVNAMDYGIEPPRRDDFRLVLEGAPSLHAPGERYVTLRMAVKAREVAAADRPPALLIFCVDVSGSMNRENRLGLVKRALIGLLDELGPDDRVGLVVYGASGRVLLEPTRDLGEIGRGIRRLQPGGSTNAEEGLRLAYRMAREFRGGTEDVWGRICDREEGETITRIILCSDGVANVGHTGPESILESVRRSADEGIELTTVGFGMGNYNDVLMEQLADAGDGRYAYVDTLEEAYRLFVTELTGTLYTVAREARAQVEFEPDAVKSWRLVGYENRDIADDRFRDPTVDAGEIGAGHTVTAVYQVKLAEGVRSRDRVATLRLRYRPADSERFREVEERLRVGDITRSFASASDGLRLAALTADFAEVLKGSYWARSVSLERVARELDRIEDTPDTDRVEDLEQMVRRALQLLQRDGVLED